MTAPLLELAHDHVQQMGDAFTSPDDDWPLTLLTECPHGERAFVVIANGAAGPALALTLQTVLANSETVRAVLVASSWVGRTPGLRPSLDPHREEQLVLYYVSRDESRYEFAPIVRSKRFPPTLGEFAAIKGGGHGRIPDAMRRGINHGIEMN